MDARTRAAALTIAVITVEDYLNMVARRLQEEAWGMEDEPDDRTSDQGQNQEGDAGEYLNQPEDGHRHELYLDREIREPDDPEPETVRGREDLGKAHEIAQSMTARSMTALARAHLQSEESNQDPQEWTLLKALASTAARTGNAAALTHHLEMLTAPGKSLAQRAGEVLASWPSQENLIDSGSSPAGQRPEPTGEEPCPGFEEAAQASNQAITLLMSTDVIGDAEEAHIVQASPLAQEAHDNGDADYILGLLWGNLGNSRAMYEWENDDHQVIMAYRFQGMTYIKLLEEAYQHPILTEEALEHCYETTYSLSWTGDSPTPEEIAGALAEIVDGSTPRQMDYEDVTAEWNEMLEGDRTETHWHSHETGLGQVSSRWPDTLFMLSTSGEDGEHQQDYYLNA